MPKLIPAAESSWPILDQLLDAALDLPEDQREAFLVNLPLEQQADAARIRRLLGRTRSPLDSIPPVELGGEDPAAEPGTAIGPYRLSRLLGEGGMGTVWLAERTDGLFRRQVALKLPRGTWQRVALSERLGREREILATLDHPHIARLYDAGLTGEGRPWLAMEHVEGRSLSAFAAEEHLGARARVQLFLQVASAVAHAHGRLVVHRDLKPSNILVTREGQVRLLDFGIAKILETGAPSVDLTAAHGRAYTPAYASPEQIAGAPLGVGTDVYSMGVVLFELLTSALPYAPARDTRAALEEAVVSAEPPRPSQVVEDRALRKALRGDLDTILLKALKKKVEERYPSADAFAQDLSAWLAGRPVQAQPDRLSYRLRKFVVRNTLLVGASASIVLALAAG